MKPKLAGLHVWVTRPQPEAEESARMWASTGAATTPVPFLHVTQLSLDSEQVEPVRSRRPDAIVFTSARACEYLSVVLRAHAGVMGALREVPAWCVGSATAAAVRVAGFEIQLVNEKGGAAELATEMTGRLSAESIVLFPCSAQRRPELPSALEKASIQLIEWPVYDVVPMGITEPRHREELAEHAPVLLIYSPSAAVAVAKSLRRLGKREVRVAAIGKSTAAAAQEWELEVVAVAAKPTEEALVTAVSEWWERESS